MINIVVEQTDDDWGKLVKELLPSRGSRISEGRRCVGEALAEIARSYAVSHSTISRLSSAT
jgi:hypothetical protein